MRATVRALIALLPVLLAAPAVASAQNGKPFRALQAQITDLRQQIQRIAAQNGSLEERISALGAAVLLLETRIESAEATLEDLAAHDELLDRWIADLYERWRAAEDRLAANEESIEALIDADRALQELIAALERQTGERVGELGTQIEELREELAAKQAAIVGACPSGSTIRQISSTGTLTCESHSTTGGGGAVGRLVTTEWSDDLRKVAAGSAGQSTIVCPSGSVATGGGYHKSAAAPLFISAPKSNGWIAAVLNTTASEVSVRAFVTCATVLAQ